MDVKNVLLPSTTSSQYTCYLPNILRDVHRVEVLFANYIVSGTPVYLDIEELRSPVYNMTATLNSGDSTTKYSSFAVLPETTAGVYTTQQYPIVIDYPCPIGRVDKLTVTWSDETGTPIVTGGAKMSALLRFFTKRNRV